MNYHPYRNIPIEEIIIAYSRPTYLKFFRWVWKTIWVRFLVKALFYRVCFCHSKRGRKNKMWKGYYVRKWFCKDTITNICTPEDDWRITDVRFSPRLSEKNRDKIWGRIAVYNRFGK